jgi:hypothetical protein
VDDDELDERYWELVEKLAAERGMTLEDFVKMVWLQYGPPPGERNCITMKEDESKRMFSFATTEEEKALEIKLTEI